MLPESKFTARALTFACIFVASFLLLFIGMDLRPNIYDESLVLTGAMRILSGQVPHRDFYAIYGPAQFYLLAGLFKFFGPSVFVERLFDLLTKGILVASVYTLLAGYTRKAIALLFTFATVMWLFAENSLTGTAVIPVSLINLLGAAAVLPAFSHPPSRRDLLFAGALSGIGILFRYDTGAALLGIQLVAFMTARFFRRAETPAPLSSATRDCLTSLLAFATVVFLPLLFYITHVPWADFAHDIILYPAEFYHKSRNLPLPAIGLKTFDNLAVYLPIAVLLTVLLTARALRVRPLQMGLPVRSEGTDLRLLGFFLVFGLLTLFMFAKGFVRICIFQMYLCIVPSLLLLAILLEYRHTIARPLRLLVITLTILSALAVLRADKREVNLLQSTHSSVPARALALAHHTVSPKDAAWCSTIGPLTKGICFEPDPDRIQTIDYLLSHSQPGQTLYVGLPHHDRIFISEQLIYFATQRLPATKWSDFNPHLQNSAPIQRQIVDDLEKNRPPYIVLDSEFENVHEPNDSDQSSGVMLLDVYVHQSYHTVQTFGDMAILQRNFSVLD